MRTKITYLLVLLFLISCKPQEEVTISVMTYNIRYGLANDGENSWEFRKKDLVTLIKSKSPDFLGTQEGLPFQVNFIKESMPNYTFIGKDRDGNGQGENTAIFYNQKKFKMIENQTFWLAKNQTTPNKDWDAAFPRIYTYGLFEEVLTRKKCWIINTHFDHLGKVARVESAKLIVAKIEDINTKKYPVFFIGDLNVEPTSEVVKIIKKLLLDTNKDDTTTWTFNGFVFNNPIKKRIDYIFISKDNISINKFEILTNSKDSKYPSDHFPVYSEFTF